MTVLWPVLAAALSFVAWQPFVRPDFDVWKADDGEYHLLRVYVFEAAVRGGEWLPRWTPDLFVGYGYPIFNYYAPGTYYLALLPRLLGLDVYTTVQALGAFAACIGAAGAYCLARAVFGGVLPGLVAALAFAYAPYPFITNLVIRADLAEALGLALLPWTLLAAWRAGRRPDVATVAWLAASMGAVILTHNLTALIALPAAGATGLFAAWRQSTTRADADGGPSRYHSRPTASRDNARVVAGVPPLPLRERPGAHAVGGGGEGHPPPAATHRNHLAGAQAVLAGLALALALTAFFWVPALVEQRHVQIEIALDGGHKSWRSWLVNPLGSTDQTRQAGNPQTTSGPLDLHLAYPYNLNYPPKPSLVQGALFGVSLALLLGFATRRRPGSAEGLFFLGGTAALWLLTTTWGTWVWEQVPLMRFLQFSWRLYGPFALALALTAAAATAIALRPGGSAPAVPQPPAVPTSPHPDGSRLPFPKRKGPGVRSASLRWARWIAALPAALAVALAANTTTDRPIWVSDPVERRVGGPQLVGTENTLFGAGTTTGGEFVPRTVDLPALGDGKRRGNGVYERLYPEFGWLAGRVWPLLGTLRVAELAGGITWTEARVEAETPSVLAFRTIAFPGWRAYLDGHEVTPGTAPRDAALDVAPGFLTVAVPPGEHRVQVAFGPTRIRTLAAAASVLTLAGLCWWIGLAHRPRRTAAVRRALRFALALAPTALFAVACAHDALRPGLAAPVAARPNDSRLVVDLADAAARRQVRVASPNGPELGPFVHLKRLGIGGRERRFLYMHPPSSVAITLDLPDRPAFQAGLALDPGMWDAPEGDGVRFVLEVTPEGGPLRRVFEEHVNPRADDGQRRWLDRWIDLSEYSNRRVTLTLRTDPAQNPSNDWAGWADPAIILQRDARRPGGGPAGPLPTPRAS